MLAIVLIFGALAVTVAPDMLKARRSGLRSTVRKVR